MSALFAPLRLRDLTLRNRIFVSPMCQYSSVNGLPHAWHMVHLGSRAIGGAGLVMAEASAVSPQGRISPDDAGIWSDAHADAWAPITAFIKANGAVAGMQLAHAGRKASTFAPFKGHGIIAEDAGGWQTIAPSAVAFSDKYPHPCAMTRDDIEQAVADFVHGAQLALRAGFDLVELHAAHGYLMHQFLSPLSNHRTDEYGGSLDNRMRFALRVAQAVRDIWPAHLPLFVRISATEWADGGWDLEQSIVLCQALKAIGVDLIDVSSGGNISTAKIPLAPGYQVPFSATIRKDAAIATCAVGLITDAVQAEQIVSSGQADAVCLARALLRDPYWPLHAAAELRVEMPWPDQYKRALVGPLGK